MTNDAPNKPSTNSASKTAPKIDPKELEAIQEDIQRENNHEGEYDLTTKINRETARIEWSALEQHFAQGNLISVDKELDLVVVAKAVADDDTAQIKAWMDAAQVMTTNDQQALLWQKNNQELWAVVIKPWILVQDR